MQQTSAVLIIIFREAQYLAHRHTAELKPELSSLDCQPHFCPLCHSALLFTLKRGLLGNNGRLALPTGVSWKPIASRILPTFTEAAHTHAHTFADDDWHRAPWSSLEKVLGQKLLEGRNCDFGSPHTIGP